MSELHIDYCSRCADKAAEIARLKEQLAEVKGLLDSSEARRSIEAGALVNKTCLVSAKLLAAEAKLEEAKSDVVNIDKQKFTLLARAEKAEEQLAASRCQYANEDTEHRKALAREEDLNAKLAARDEALVRGIEKILSECELADRTGNKDAALEGIAYKCRALLSSGGSGT